MAEAGLLRRGPLDGGAADREGALSALPPISRFSFRGGRDAARRAGEALGVSLPLAACRAATAGERAALWLGPDEWLLLAPEREGPQIARTIVQALAGTAYALVDLGHRDAAIGVAGPHCEDIINGGCPLDLDIAAFPVGMCTRTVFAKAGIVLWRYREDRFRIETARSFARYVWVLLDEVRRDTAQTGRPRPAGEAR